MNEKNYDYNFIKLSSFKKYEFISSNKTSMLGFARYKFKEFNIRKLDKGYLFQKLDLTFLEPFLYIKKKVRFVKSTKK
jgi:hypothetical protein